MADSAIIPITDPGAQLAVLRSEIDEAIGRVLTSGRFVLGPEVEAFESEFATYIGTSHAVGVANGTDALALALRSLGIGMGDEVITVSHTAVATVAAIEQCGATPVLVDVEPGYLTLDPNQLEGVMSARTRAVVPVHLYGQAADLRGVQAFCRRHDLAVVEDASQAHGATWGGAKLGSIGDLGVFSCYPTKNLGALGDAGIVATSSEALAGRLKRLRQYGWRERNLSLDVGVNSRLDEMQAAILRVKLTHLDENNAKRRAVAAEYQRAFEELPMEVPKLRHDATHVFHLYVAEVRDRQDFQRRLAERGIETAVHYPTPVHKQPAYAGRLRKSARMQVTEQSADRIVSLPIYPEMTHHMIRRVLDGVCSALERRDS